MTAHLRSLVVDAPDPAELALFWGTLLGRPAAMECHEVLVAGTGTELALRFVAGTASAPPHRMHLHLTSEDLADQHRVVERAVRLGATHLDVGQTREEGHVVLQDPAGYEFCVIEPHNSYLDGCGFLAEVACDGSRAVGEFWSAVLAWPLVWDEGDETAIQSPEGGTKIGWGGPSEGLVTAPFPQRFEVVVPGRDLEEEVGRILALGATRLDHDGDGDGTIRLADPDGHELVLTTLTAIQDFPLAH